MSGATREKVPARGQGSLNYLRIVALHISGYSHAQIAEQLDITPETASRALNSPEGIALLNEAKRRMRENVFGRIEAEIVDLAEMSINNIRETVEAKFIPGSRGKIHQDTMGLKLLGIIGYNEEAMKERRGSSLTVSDELGKRLLKALEKSEESEQLHRGRDVTELASPAEEPETVGVSDE